jgi:hypothetical protein
MFYRALITVEGKVYTAEIIVNSGVRLGCAEGFFEESLRGRVLLGVKQHHALLYITGYGGQGRLCQEYESYKYNEQFFHEVYCTNAV